MQIQCKCHFKWPHPSLIGVKERELRPLAACVKFEAFYECKCQYFYYIHKPDYIQSDQFQEKYEMKLRWTVVGFVCPLNIGTQQPLTIGVFETGHDCYIYWRHNSHGERELVWLEYKKN